MRTVQAAPQQSKHNGKWACIFEMFSSYGGEEYKSAQFESPALWFDAAAARLAGERALEVLKTTGMFPNMCELW